MISRIGPVLRRLAASDFARKASGTLLTRFAVSLINLANTVLVTRALGPEGRGVYSVGLAIGDTGAQFSNLGLHAANTFYAAKDRGLLARLVGNSLIVGVFLGTISAAIGWTLAALFPSIAPVEGAILALALAYVPLCTVYQLLQGILLGLYDVRCFNIAELLFRSASVALVVLFFLLWGATPEHALTGLVAALTLAVLFCLYRLYHGHRSGFAFQWAVFRRMFGYAVKSYFGSLTAFLLYRIDLLIVNQLLGKEQAGLYSVAIALAMMVEMAPAAVSQIFSPKVIAIKERGEKWKATSILLKIVAAGVLVLCVVCFFAAETLVRLLFGDAFSGASTAFVILLIAVYVRSITGLLGTFVASINIPRSGPIFGLVVVLLNYFLNLALVERLGIAGAAVAASICAAVFLPYTGLYVVRIVKYGKVNFIW